MSDQNDLATSVDCVVTKCWLFLKLWFFVVPSHMPARLLAAIRSRLQPRGVKEHHSLPMVSNAANYLHLLYTQ